MCCVIIRLQSIRTFWGSSMNPMAPSLSSPPPNQTNPWKLDQLQRTPRSRQLTVPLGTVLNQKRTFQDRAAACLRWRTHHARLHQSLQWKIHTTLIVTLVPFSLWHSSLSISSTGFTISSSEHYFQASAILFSPFLKRLYLLIQDPIPDDIAWTQTDPKITLYCKNKRLLSNRQGLTVWKPVKFSVFITLCWTLLLVIHEQSPTTILRLKRANAKL